MFVIRVLPWGWEPGEPWYLESVIHDSVTLTCKRANAARYADAMIALFVGSQLPRGTEYKIESLEE